MKAYVIRVKPNKMDLFQNKSCSLIEPAVLVQVPNFKEGDLFVLKGNRDEFLGKGYFGNQNKGIGWILSKDKDVEFDQDFFNHQLLKAIRNRDTYFNDELTSAFRLFNGEGDGIGGLAIDYYNGYIVITWYSEGIYSFKDKIIRGLESFRFKGIYQKKRFGAKGSYIEEVSYLSGEKAPEPLIIIENGVHYATYLEDGAMTGIFLDQKEVRRQLKNFYSKGKTVLNTFSYTGAFSVAAKVGGALKTTSVDLAKRSLPKTMEQFQMNGLNPETEDIVVMDVFDYFKWAIKKKKTFDLVILDPPAFAKSKKITFSVTKDYTQLIEYAIDLSTEDGLIVASTNSANYELDHFMKDIHKGFIHKKQSYDVLETYRLPGDFVYNEHDHKGNYLKVVFLRKKV